MKNKTPAPAMPSPVSVPSLGTVILVRYRGPTDRAGSRWIATLDRGKPDIFRASARFNYAGSENDGSDAAAGACLEKYQSFLDGRFSCKLTGRARLSSDSFVYTFETV
ncbi:MAG: hypothetical protein ACK5VI_04275 [Opitutia bacterium]